MGGEGQSGSGGATALLGRLGSRPGSDPADVLGPVQVVRELGDPRRPQFRVLLDQLPQLVPGLKALPHAVGRFGNLRFHVHASHGYTSCPEVMTRAHAKTQTNTASCQHGLMLSHGFMA